MSRPALAYGVAACESCHKTAAQGLELEPTGATKSELLPFQKGRKVLRGGGEVRDLGPRFAESNARPWAELRCTACGHAFWSLAPQAVQDARAKNEDVKG